MSENPDGTRRPVPETGILPTHLIVADTERSKRFHADIPGGEPAREGEPTMVVLANSWVIINRGGGPTEDKPTVTLEVPSGDVVSRPAASPRRARRGASTPTNCFPPNGGKRRSSYPPLPRSSASAGSPRRRARRRAGGNRARGLPYRPGPGLQSAGHLRGQPCLAGRRSYPRVLPRGPARHPGRELLAHRDRLAHLQLRCNPLTPVPFLRILAASDRKDVCGGHRPQI